MSQRELNSRGHERGYSASERKIMEEKERLVRCGFSFKKDFGKNSKKGGKDGK